MICRIDLPVEDVFAFWCDYENFPRFLSNVREVTRTRVDGQSHWTVAGPGGISVEFDATITDFVPNELLAWRTVEGSLVQHAGVIRFEATVGGGTRLHIRMSYTPPLGAVGHGIASVLGDDLKSKLDEDLVRMKTLLETGRPARDAAKPWVETPTAPRVF